jgi:hypothetical protein
VRRVSGSRWSLVVASVAALVGGCTLGPPPGYSSGDSWSFPLVGPLENGNLVVPVKVHDRGPYLFVIDPDAPRSSVDAALDSELDLYSKMGGEYPDESDVLRRVRFAEVLRIQIGTLTVRNRRFWVHAVGTYNVAGRQIRGVIGKDLLADSLVFGFDRDLGLGYLATQKGFKPPAGAIRFGYYLDKYNSGRRIVDARLDGKVIKLHIDLGEVASQVREKLWPRYGLEREPIKRALIDEMGTVRTVDTGAHAGLLEIGDASARNILVVPYRDRRIRTVDLDGTVGLGFFEGYSVWHNYDDHTITLVPRRTDDVSRQRMERWGWEALAGCAAPGCAHVELIEEPVEPGMEDRPQPPPLLVIDREASAQDVAIELMIEARGGSVDLPRLIVSIPAGTQQFTQPLGVEFRGATLAVVDINPYPRACRTERPCIYTLP